MFERKASANDQPGLAKTGARSPQRGHAMLLGCTVEEHGQTIRCDRRADHGLRQLSCEIPRHGEARRSLSLGPRLYYFLEMELRGELHQAGRRRANDASETGIFPLAVDCRTIELRMVEGIECLDTELQ